MTQLNIDVASVILEYADYFEQAVLFDILFPGCRHICYKRNIKIIKKKEYIEYRLFRRLHRENDLPAVECFNGQKEWWFKGLFHRDGDKPAVIGVSGTQRWYINGKLHRENDMPAVIRADGSEEWYINDKLHRIDDMPAVIDADGSQEWWVNGKRHRDNGMPADIHGYTQEWWVNYRLIRVTNKLPSGDLIDVNGLFN
jgi:hypothetical protein